jgi:hypothetical protein
VIWATLRMHRWVFLVSVAVIAAFAVWLAISGLAQVHAWALIVSHHCTVLRPGSEAARCYSYESSYANATHFNHVAVGVCIVLPALFGLVIGSPLVATELQQSTNRLAWSQSITRTRWLAAKLGVGTLVVAVPTAARHADSAMELRHGRDRDRRVRALRLRARRHARRTDRTSGLVLRGECSRICGRPPHRARLRQTAAHLASFRSSSGKHSAHRDGMATGDGLCTRRALFACTRTNLAVG